MLFIDTIEANMPGRRRNGSTTIQRAIHRFIGEVNRFPIMSEDHVMLLVGAANAPDGIGLAMVQRGRLDGKVHVALPDKAAHEEILRLCLGTGRCPSCARASSQYPILLDLI